jgi:Flp pilus assembly secretin CpaC
MSIILDRFGANGRRIVLVALLLVAGASSTAAQDRNPGSSGAVTITVDQAHVMKLPEGVATMVVGNPLIADISIQSGGMAVLTGKGHGVTNILALDRSGTVLEQTTIQVQGARDSVVVYRGVERESYSCMPKCERRITLGDSNAYFGAALAQTGARTGRAQNGSESSK